MLRHDLEKKISFKCQKDFKMLEDSQITEFLQIAKRKLDSIFTNYAHE